MNWRKSMIAATVFVVSICMNLFGMEQASYFEQPIDPRDERVIIQKARDMLLTHYQVIKAYKTVSGEKFTPQGLSAFVDSLGWTIMIRDFYGGTLLHVAAMDGDVAIVEALMSLMSDGQKTEILMSLNMNAETALHKAAYESNVEIAAILINAINNPKLRVIFIISSDNFDNTALHIAAKNGCDNLISLMLESINDLQLQRAYIQHVGYYGEGDALHIAHKYGQMHTVEMLLEYYRRLGIPVPEAFQ